MNMKFQKINILLVGLVSFVFLNACDDTDDVVDTRIIDHSFHAVSVNPINSSRIGWDYSSLQRLANRGANPKMIRTGIDELVATYAYDGIVYIVKSEDNGQTWGSPQTLFPRGSHNFTIGTSNISVTHLMSQPSLALLPDGTLIAACAIRHRFSYNNVNYELAAGISVRRVNVDDFSMETQKTVFLGIAVEHPSLLLLPDGKLQLYFSFVASTPIYYFYSEIATLFGAANTSVVGVATTVIESNDNGKTWTSHVREFGPDGRDSAWIGNKIVARRAGFDNIMPAPAVVGNNIVIALSDMRELTYKVYTVRSPLSENWVVPVMGDTPDRQHALLELLADRFYMGSPSLLVLPSGETLLSYDADEARNTGFEVMEVAIGNNQASDFTHRSRPFPFNDEEKAIGGALMLFDERTVVATTSSNRGLVTPPAITATSTVPWYMKGYIMNDLTVTESQINEHPLFVSATTGATLNAGLGIDASNLYINVRVNDETPVNAQAGATTGDGVYLYIDAANMSLLRVHEGMSKFWVSSTGDVLKWNGFEGQWVSASAGNVTVSAAASVNNDGYTLEITIPRASLTNFNSQGIRFGLALTDFIDDETGETELMTLCQDLRSSTWLGVKF